MATRKSNTSLVVMASHTDSLVSTRFRVALSSRGNCHELQASRKLSRGRRVDMRVGRIEKQEPAPVALV